MSADASKRKGFKDYLVMIFGGILAVVIIFVVFIDGIEYHIGGAKVFDASASTEEGKRFVNEYKLKYICSSVYGLEYADFYRSDCKFVSDVDWSNPEEIRYRVVQEEYVSKFSLQPGFSWWERNGKFISPIIVILILVIAYQMLD
jgi:hypothetical protein